MLGLLRIVIGAGGSVLASTLGNMLKTVISEKVVKRILIILISKLVKGTKTNTDDKIWSEMLKALEEE